MSMQQTLHTVTDLYEYLRSLHKAQESGEVIVQNGASSAKIYLSGGLIVWAFASNQKESFQSILLKEKGYSKEKLIESINQSRKVGKKHLDDILLALKIDDLNKRREIIERHTRAALQTIAEWSSQGSEGGSSVAQLNIKSGTEDTPEIRFTAEELLWPEPRIAIKRSTASQQPKAEALPAKDVPEILERLRAEVPNFIAAVVIDGKTGMPIASIAESAENEELDSETVSAFYRNLHQAAIEAAQGLPKVTGEAAELEEIMLTSNHHFVLVRVLDGGKQLLFLLLDQNSNPGMARVVLKRYLERLSELL